jgi:hypothetical protein
MTADGKPLTSLPDALSAAGSGRLTSSGSGFEGGRLVGSGDDGGSTSVE